MGMLRVEIGLTNLLRPHPESRLELLVDTGALYSIIPAARLRELGIEPRERQLFRLADGREIQREVGMARFTYNGREGISKVVFGEEGDASVLGVVALEELGLEVDPVRGELRPATLFLFLADKKRQEALRVDCPHCGSKLVIDAELAAVIDHEPPPKPPAIADLAEAAKGLEEQARKREEKFLEEFAAQKTRSEVLAKKFEEQFNKAKDQPVTKPLRDFDLD